MSKRRTLHAWNEDFETMARHWPYVPDHAKRTMIDLVSSYGPAVDGKRFPTPPGINWADIEILLLTPQEAKFTAGSVSQSYTFAAVGLADKRNTKRPRAEWRMLRTYAENPEPDAYYKLPYRENLKVDISNFRQWLKGFFGLPGDPLKPFKTGLWLPRFKIRADY